MAIGKCYFHSSKIVDSKIANFTWTLLSCFTIDLFQFVSPEELAAVTPQKIAEQSSLGDMTFFLYLQLKNDLVSLRNNDSGSNSCLLQTIR